MENIKIYLSIKGGFLKHRLIFPAFMILILFFSCSSIKMELPDNQQLIRIACVGDSITYGANIRNRHDNSYPSQLAQMLGSGWAVGNFGVSGATLLKNGDKPYWETDYFEAAHLYNPHIVIIKLGTNDSKGGNWRHKEDFISDYLELIKSFSKNERKPKIWICYPVPAFPGRWGISDDIIKNEIKSLIDDIAFLADVEIIDLYSALNGKGDMFPDKIHPNAEGAGLIAKTIFNIIFNDKLMESYYF